MKQEFYIRPIENKHLSVSLPIYAYSTGVFTRDGAFSNEKLGALTPFVELVWGLEGIGEVGLYGQSFRIEPGDVFYYLPGEDHSKRALSRKWRMRWLCFDGPFAQAIMLSYNYPRLQRARSEYPEALFAEIERRITVTDPFDLRRLAALVMEALAYAGGTVPDGPHSQRTVKRAVEFILANLDNPQLGVGLLCRALSVPPSTLNLVFREELGKTPGRFILDRRLEQAQSLLLGTDLPVKKVAEQCGFSDAQTFTRFVKRSVRLTPRQLRRRTPSPD